MRMEEHPSIFIAYLVYIFGIVFSFPIGVYLQVYCNGPFDAVTPAIPDVDKECPRFARLTQVLNGAAFFAMLWPLMALRGIIRCLLSFLRFILTNK